MPAVVASDESRASVVGAIRNTLHNRPPAFHPHLHKHLVQLHRDMCVGPHSWQSAARLLGLPDA